MAENLRIWRSTGLECLYLPVTHGHVSDDGVDSRTPSDCFASALPEALQSYWQRTCLPIRSVWTYLELDADMSSAVETERLRLLRSIMRAKNLAEEQVCLWPIVVRSQAGQAQPCWVDFMNLVKRYMPQYVLSFGDETHAAIEECFSQADAGIPEKCTLVRLPSLNEMLPDNKQAKFTTWNIIKHLEI